MRKSLRTKYFILYLVLILAVFIVFNTFGTARLRATLSQSRKDSLYDEATIISESYMENYFSDLLSFQYLKTQLSTIDRFLDVRIWIVNRQEELILDTRSSASPDNPISISQYDENFLSRQSTEHFTMGDLVSSSSMAVVMPISVNYSIRGYLVMLSSYDAIEDSLNLYMNTINSCLLLFFGILLVLLLLLYFMVAVPLHKLVRSAKAYSAGHFDQMLELKNQDEFKDLNDSINFLAHRLDSLDAYQAKFIANVSHDFRSPLTSIKGYAEAMIDGTIPPEMQEKYLGVIVFETERLTKLTTNLLDLNNFKKNGAGLHVTLFDLNDIIKKTAATFEGTCGKKHLTVKLTFEENETYVEADLGKIQQVLYNLLDNAIKFSPNGSSISIKTQSRNGKIYTSVKDHGCGIPQEDLNRIWDRFYKSDQSRGKDKKGTGLGLSITKEIMNAHKENINVISTTNAGSEFIFSLPAASSEEVEQLKAQSRE